LYLSWLWSFTVRVVTGFVQNLKVLGWMSLNLKTKIQGLECLGICKEVLESPWILLALVYGYFLKLFDIQNEHFVELILHVHICQSCLKLIKVAFWSIQRQILLISNPFSSVFSPWIWHVRTLLIICWTIIKIKELKSSGFGKGRC
jgi:hypothetical protein